MSSNNQSHKLCIIFVFMLFVCGFAYAQSEAAREFNRKGVTATASGHHQEAVKFLKNAMELAPEWGEPVYNAGMLLKLRGRTDEAFKQFKKAYTLDPKNIKYLDEYTKFMVDKLDVAEKKGATSEALALRREIVEVNPAKLSVGLGLINHYKKSNNLTKARETAELLLDKNSAMRTRYDSEEMGLIFLFLAEDHFEKNNLNEARSNIDNALKYSLSNSSYARELQTKIRNVSNKKVADLISKAQEAKENGKNDSATALLKQALEIQPNNESAKSLIDALAFAKSSAQILAEAKKYASEQNWIAVRDSLQGIVAENSEARKLYETAVAKEREVLKVLGQTSPLSSIKEERNNLANEFLSRANSFFDAKNYIDAKLNYERGLKLVKFDKELKNSGRTFEEGIQRIEEIESRKTNWEKAIENRNIGDYPEVVKLLRKLPNDYDVQLPSYLAEALWKTGEAKEALEYANLQLARQPENNRAKFVIGSVNLEMGNKDIAFKYFTEIRNSDPGYPELNDKLLLSSVSKLKYILPIVAIVILLWISYAIYKYLPEYNKNTSINKAKKYLKKDMLKECIDELTKVRRLPILTAYDSAIISRILAQAFLKKGVYDKAIGECKHLISLNVKDEEAHLWLAYAYLGRRMLTPESLPELLNLYKKEPRNLALVSLLGTHYTQQKSLSDEGVGVLEQWLTLDPNNPEVLKPLGRYYLKMSKTDDKAMKVFQKMMEIMASHNEIEPEFLLGVARIHVKMHQYDECLHLCEQVINADINNELVHPVLIDVYARKNELPNLIEIYGNFLKKNPYNVAFQNGLLEARKKIENLEKAEKEREIQQARENEIRIRKEQREQELERKRQLELAQQEQAEQPQAEQEQDQAEQPSENTEIVQNNDSNENAVDEEQPQNLEEPEEPKIVKSIIRPLENSDIECPNCKYVNPGNAYTCSHCGTNLF